MARKTSHTYDPKTGTWGTNTSKGSTTNTSKKKSTKSDTGGNTKSSSNTDKNTSKGSSEKKYNEIEINVLKGSISAIATPDTLKIKVGDTITLKGIGKYLSGNYYVESINRKIDNSGYSHTFEVIKMNFGDTLKSSPKKSTSSKKKASKVLKKTSKKTYTCKKGDTIYTIAKKYYGSTSKYKKILDANKSIKKSQYNKLPIGLKISIP